MFRNYILEGKLAVACHDPVKFSTWFTMANRRIKRDEVGDCTISTVFLGIDHSFTGGKPILFETRVFGGDLDGEQERCTTWEEAEAMHKNIVARVLGIKDQENE